MTRTRQLAMLTALAVLAVMAGGWTLLVKPKQAEITEVRDQVDAQLASNKTVENEIQRLKAQAKNLPQTQHRLAEIGRKVPNTPALPSLIRSLTEASEKAGTVLVSLTPSAPELRAAAPVGAPTAATATAPATGTTAAAPAAPAATEALAYIPIKVRIIGGYFHLEDFLSNIEGLPRAYLVSEISVTQVKDRKSNRLALSYKNPLEIEITGRVFMSVPRPAPVAPVAAAPAS